MEDHEPIKVGDIGNYYGSLWLRRVDGKDQWSIENYDGHHWEGISEALASELRKITSAPND